MTARPRLQFERSGTFWGFRAYPTKMHDGDSFWVMADLGFGARYEAELRLLDVSAPEVKPMQPGGAETTRFVTEWLADAAARSTSRWCLWVEVILTKAIDPQMKMTFTRYVATVSRSVDADTARSLNEEVQLFLAQHPDWPAGQ